ncbi:hypothetical protein ANN_26175, partial [Periplaneta americana]
APNAIQPIVAYINNKLNTSTTSIKLYGKLMWRQMLIVMNLFTYFAYFLRHEGLLLLKTFLPQCSVDLFGEYVVSWMEQCLKIREDDQNKKVFTNTSYQVLKILLQMSDSMPELKRPVSGLVVPKVIDNFQQILPKEAPLSVLECLEILMSNYGPSCGQQKCKMAGVLHECTREEQHVVVCFLWAKELSTEKVHHKMCPMYDKNCLSQKVCSIGFKSLTRDSEASEIGSGLRKSHGFTTFNWNPNNPPWNENILRSHPRKVQDDDSISPQSYADCVLRQARLKFQPHGQAVNVPSYCTSLRELQQAIYHKRPGLLTMGVILLDINARPPDQHNSCCEHFIVYAWNIHHTVPTCPHIALQNILEKCLLQYIDTVDVNISKRTARCVAFLPLLGGGGSLGANHVARWKQDLQKICATLHRILDDLFDNIRELPVCHKALRKENSYRNTTESETLPLPAITETTPLVRVYQLATRFVNVSRCLQAMLVCEFPVEKTVLPDVILGLVCRGLGVNSHTLGKKVSTDLLMVGAMLPQIHVSLLNIVDALITCCGRNLLPFASVICKLVLQTLKWTSTEKWMYGIEKPYGQLRVAAYNTLTLWLQTSNCSSCVELLSEQLVSIIVQDIRFEKELVTLSVSKIPLWLNSAVMRENEVKNSKSNTGKKQHKNKQALPDEQGIDKSKRHIPDQKANSKTCKAALKALQWILHAAASFIKPDIHRLLQEITVGQLCDIQRTSKPQDLPLPYCDAACRLELYQLLYTLTLEPHTTWPPPTQFALCMLSRGRSDLNMKMAALPEKDHMKTMLEKQNDMKKREENESARLRMRRVHDQRKNDKAYQKKLKKASNLQMRKMRAKRKAQEAQSVPSSGADMYVSGFCTSALTAVEKIVHPAGGTLQFPVSVDEMMELTRNYSQQYATANEVGEFSIDSPEEVTEESSQETEPKQCESNTVASNSKPVASSSDEVEILYENEVKMYDECENDEFSENEVMTVDEDSEEVDNRPLSSLGIREFPNEVIEDGEENAEEEVPVVDIADSDLEVEEQNETETTSLLDDKNDRNEICETPVPQVEDSENDRNEICETPVPQVEDSENIVEDKTEPPISRKSDHEVATTSENAQETIVMSDSTKNNESASDGNKCLSENEVIQTEKDENISQDMQARNKETEAVTSNVDKAIFLETDNSESEDIVLRYDSDDEKDDDGPSAKKMKLDLEESLKNSDTIITNTLKTDSLKQVKDNLERQINEEKQPVNGVGDATEEEMLKSFVDAITE